MMIKRAVDITNNIYLIRDHKVMLDEDLASLYGVEVKRLNEQVQRNRKRFPKDLTIIPGLRYATY